VPITPLPTVYRDVSFRSRLEADWAATLDDRRISWQYEPEGFRLSDGTWYAPDFWLPSASAWLEVKGSHMDRYSKTEQFAADLWSDSGTSSPTDRQAPMILVGLDPGRRERLHGFGYYDAPNIHAIDETGNPYDVGFTTCRTCSAGTVFVFGQDHCRGCNTAGPGVQDGLYGGWIDVHYADRPFIRVPRDFGRRSA
jgi:hypothetical protein